MSRIAIHGFGRIGRSLLRVALKNDLFVPVSVSDIKDVQKPPHVSPSSGISKAHEVWA